MSSPSSESLGTCFYCGHDLARIARSGRTRDYGRGRVVPIPADFPLLSCTNEGCPEGPDDYYAEVDVMERLDALIDPDRATR